MVEILKFIRTETAFDPEFIQVLASAFEDAWTRIEESGSRFARPVLCGIAKRIIETGQRGVKDPSALADDAVKFLTTNYEDSCAARLTELP